MFHWIVMDVVQMVVEVILVADDVIPEPVLPEMQLFLGGGERFHSKRGPALDRVHDLRYVSGGLWLEEKVHMVPERGVRQHAEGMEGAHIAHSVEEGIHAGLIAKDEAAVASDRSDEVDGIGYVVASEVGHGGPPHRSR